MEADLERRFGGIARLYGAEALERFRRAHVCVIGIGGVGSWAAEALARSAVGRITRSEEHTTELQSQFHLAYSLLFFNDTATPEISTLSLHDALPISCLRHWHWRRRFVGGGSAGAQRGRPHYEIGRAHDRTPVTVPSRIQSSFF